MRTVNERNQIADILVRLLFSLGSVRVVPDLEKSLPGGLENSSRHAAPFVPLLQK